METSELTLKILLDGVIIPVATIELIYSICQFLKDFLSSTIVKWLLSLFGKSEWAKYFPYILPYILAFIFWYEQNPNVWQDGLTWRELFQLLVYIIVPQVQHRELRKLAGAK